MLRSKKLFSQCSRVSLLCLTTLTSSLKCFSAIPYTERRYNNVNIDLSEYTKSADTFEKEITSSIDYFIKNNKRAIWAETTPSQSYLIPTLFSK